jgi:hypothetical protein
MLERGKGTLMAGNVNQYNHYERSMKDTQKTKNINSKE